MAKLIKEQKAAQGGSHAKKKIVVNRQADIPLQRVAQRGPNSSTSNIKSEYKVEFRNGVYLAAGHGEQVEGAQGEGGRDWLRGALGKGFEYRKKTLGDTYKVYDNDWEPVNVFYSRPLAWEAPEAGEDCYFEFESTEDPTFGLANTQIKQKIIIKCDVPLNDLGATIQIFTEPDESELVTIDSELKKWAALIKTGFTEESGQALRPRLRANHWFYDHYHDTLLPFTEEELLDKNPAGKAFYIKFKSYYSEIMSSSRSALYENYTSNKTRLHNSLPNIYAFVKLMDQSAAMASGVYDLSEIMKYIQYYLVGPDDSDKSIAALPGTTVKRAPGIVYKHLLRLYPLETLATLFGIIGADEGVYQPEGVLEKQGLEILNPAPGYNYPTKIIEKIITLNPDRTDMTGLIRSYIREWMGTLQYEETAQYLGVNYLRTEEQFRLRLGALENIGYNLIFSPNMMKFLNKANKIKNHFPMYNHVEFSTSTSTILGDFMKKFFITKFLATQIAASQPYYPYAKWGSADPLGYSWYVPAPDQTNKPGTQYGPPYFQNYTGIVDFTLHDDAGTPYVEAPVALAKTQGDMSLSNIRDFVEYEDITEYTTHTDADQNGPSVKITTKKIGDRPPAQSRKTCIELPTALEHWIKNEDYASLNTHPSTAVYTYYEGELTGQYDTKPWGARDVRNFITYINKSGEDEINLNDEDNSIWKTLIGSAFYAKLADIYDQHKRTYADILNGVKAHTEDLFYKIEKHVKHYNADEDAALGQGQDAQGWKIVQNVIIPNTSDTNIAEHIDTEVKYGKNVAYKYKVYVYRAVYGCRYRYACGDVSNNQQDFSPQPASQGAWWTGYTKAYEDLAEHAGGKINLLKGVSFGSSEPGPPGRGTMARFAASPVVIIEPSIRLIADEVYNTGEVRILDRPPVAPHVNIVPYRATNNRIKIILSGQTDRYRQKPEVMLDSDQDDFDLIKEAQFSLDGQVEFGSDDVINNFQIFRLEERPKSYSDFKLHPSKPFIFGGSGTLEEKILSNTKYYYTFRAVDAHGHVSNPTAVYEVELIDEKGAVKPLIRTISFEQKKENLSVKECQKYVYIKPSAKQMYFSDRPEIDSVFSEEDENSTKRKKYKMRVTSKGSGKKIDINFSYVKKIITD